MKVMHVIETLGIGGAEQMLAVLLPALAEREVQVSVAVMRAPLDLGCTLESAGIRVFALPPRRKWNLLGRAWDLARLVRQQETEILHAHLYFPAICTALVRILHLGTTATVVTFHNLAYIKGVNKAGPGLLFKKSLAALLYPRGIDCKMAVSKAVASHYRTALGLAAIEVVHNPVDIAAIDNLTLRNSFPPTDSLHLVVPGRLVHEKGHCDLLYALAIPGDRSREIRVTFAGGGPMAGALTSQIEALGLGACVTITGVLEHRAIIEVINSADIVIVPSRFEGFGLTAIEAMALSKPVVVTDAGGLKEIVEDGISGIVVPAGDSKQLAAAIASLMASSQLRERLGNAGRQRVEKEFSLPLVTQKIHALYERVLTSRSASAPLTTKKERSGRQ